MDFNKLFELEIQGWLNAIKQNSENVNQKIIKTVVNDMSGCFHEAIKNNYTFDLVYIAELISGASSNKVSVKQICFYILTTMPLKNAMSYSQFQTAEAILDKACETYPKIKARMYDLWEKADKTPGFISY